MKIGKNSFVIEEAQKGLRLDKALADLFKEESRSYFSHLIEENHCQVNGAIAKASYKVNTGDVIELDIPEAKPLEVKKEDLPLDIVYEDEDILIINKAQGMVVHPSAGHHEHTLVNAILNHCETLSGINGVLRPGIVHRIDKDTSGLICVAKNDEAHRALSDQLKDHTMHRDYYALVKGVIAENSGEINLPIGRDPNNREKMAVRKENSKDAVTYFEVAKRYQDHTLVRCSLKTGRTHQIRVHMAYIGHPVEGDPLYSGRNYDRLYANGQLLTAYRLTLIHPKSKKEMSFEIDIPSYFRAVLDSLKSA